MSSDRSVHVWASMAQADMFYTGRSCYANLHWDSNSAKLPNLRELRLLAKCERKYNNGDDDNDSDDDDKDSTGWVRLIRSHLSAKIFFELSGNMN